MTPARSLPSPEGNVAGPALVQPTLADPDLARVDARGLDPHQHLPRRGHRPRYLHHRKDLDPAVVLEPHCSRIGKPPSVSRPG